MSTPKRRSARLRGTTSPARSFASYAVNKLSALLEHEITPKAQRSIDAVILSPNAAARAAFMPGAYDFDHSGLKTPENEQGPKPVLEEMHPGKAHADTTKKGVPISSTTQIAGETATPLRPTAGNRMAHSPSKPTMGFMSSPDFEFDFRSGGNDTSGDLSAEAQRIMDSVREEASKIKAQMKAEREAQEWKDAEAERFAKRRIATPKRKSGRYSAAHREEFQKMDSIANHASVWKAKLAKSSYSPLKRKDENLESSSDPASADLPKETERLENSAPGKRAKRAINDDVSSARPLTVPRPTSRDGDCMIPSPTKARGLPSAVTTPTKSSLARASPAPKARSAVKTHPQPRSFRTLSSPVRDEKTSSSQRDHKFTSAIPKVPSIKSILHKPLPKFSDDPAKIAAGTHLPTPNGKADLNKNLPALPPTPSTSLLRSPSIKRVGFITSTKDADDEVAKTPSPIKFTAPVAKQPKDTDLGTESPTKSFPRVEYPALPRYGPLSSHPPAAVDFTFRSSKHIKFGEKSPARGGPTIRHVRPSGLPTRMTTMPTVPHGLPNKKRRRAESDDGDSDVENRPPTNSSPFKEPEHVTKKVKTTNASPAKPKIDPKMAAHASAPEKRLFGLGKTEMKRPDAQRPKEKKKGVLSLARLNMLARPKRRE